MDPSSSVAPGLEETDGPKVSECALLHLFEKNAAMKCAVISLRAAIISPSLIHIYTGIQFVREDSASM